MKFDVVVGNPPYNNDIYIPFVEMGHNLASQCSVFITPAKWQAKGGEKNEAFRQNIVPYMSKIVMYRDTHDVFDIDDNAGIAYYLTDKNIHTSNWSVMGVSTKNNQLNFDWEIHNENELKLYSNKIVNIIEKCKTQKMIANTLDFKRCIYVGEQERGYSNKKYTDDVEVMQGNKLTGYMPLKELKTTDNLDMYKVTCAIMIGGAVMFNNDSKILGSASYTHVKPNQVLKGSFPCIRYFRTEQECVSFESYMMSKLISFLFFLGICGATMTNTFFQYIPDPGAFDHIFTDEELYKKYNLTPEEINIIESVIKERK
jgi:site-specific DNA-methyltransferase (adenine-specific)